MNNMNGQMKFINSKQLKQIMCGWKKANKNNGERISTGKKK